MWFAGTEMEHEPRGTAHDSDVLLRRPRQGAQTHGSHPHGEGHQPSHAQEVHSSLSPCRAL